MLNCLQTLVPAFGIGVFAFRRKTTAYGDIYPVFAAQDFIKVVFSSLIVKMDSLKAKYPGGVQAFVEEFGACCTRELAAICMMSPEYMEKPAQKLLDLGFEWDTDMAAYDANCSIMGQLARYHLAEDKDNIPTDADTGYDWLEAEVVGDCAHVRYRPPGKAGAAKRH